DCARKKFTLFYFVSLCLLEFSLCFHFGFSWFEPCLNLVRSRSVSLSYILATVAYRRLPYLSANASEPAGITGRLPSIIHHPGFSPRPRVHFEVQQRNNATTLMD